MRKQPCYFLSGRCEAFSKHFSFPSHRCVACRTQVILPTNWNVRGSFARAATYARLTPLLCDVWRGKRHAQKMFAVVECRQCSGTYEAHGTVTILAAIPAIPFARVPWPCVLPHEANWLQGRNFLMVLLCLFQYKQATSDNKGSIISIPHQTLLAKQFTN